MTKQTIITVIISAVISIVAVLGLGKFLLSSRAPSGLGAAGNLLVENYLPYVMYNGGYNSAKDVVTSAILKSTGTFQLGSSGASNSQIIKGTCSLAATAAEYPVIMVASSTAVFNCSATGVVAGDPVFVTPNIVNGTATTTWAAFGLGSFSGVAGIEFVGASSTAADNITVTLANKTGVATSSFNQATSSWSWYSIR